MFEGKNESFKRLWTEAHNEADKKAGDDEADPSASGSGAGQAVPPKKKGKKKKDGPNTGDDKTNQADKDSLTLTKTELAKEISRVRRAHHVLKYKSNVASCAHDFLLCAMGQEIDVNLVWVCRSSHCICAPTHTASHSEKQKPSQCGVITSLTMGESLHYADESTLHLGCDCVLCVCVCVCVSVLCMCVRLCVCVCGCMGANVYV